MQKLHDLNFAKNTKNLVAPPSEWMRNYDIVWKSNLLNKVESYTQISQKQAMVKNFKEKRWKTSGAS